MSEDTKKIIYSMVGVNKHYNNKPIIKDISLSYYYGAKIGVLGLNGSGKSTLLRIMAGKWSGTSSPILDLRSSRCVARRPGQTTSS